MRAAAVILVVAAVALWLPSRVDQARRNRRARKARLALVAGSSWLDQLVEDALVEGVAEGTPIHDRLVCEQLEHQFHGGAA